MRFLTALAALKNGRTLLDGSERMRKRPMAELLDGLVALGVKAYSQEGNGLPARGRGVSRALGGGGPDRGSESSQFLSALLMVAPLARGDVRLEVSGPLVSRPYVDITRE